LRCPRAAAKPCILSGTDLFLATSISATASFDSSVNVPPEFTGTELVVPHPAKGVLYLKLRDDPANAETLTLPVTLMAGSAPGAPAVAEKPVAAVPAITPVTLPAADAPAAEGPQTQAPAPKQN
jgi:hypothetical protein